MSVDENWQDKPITIREPSYRTVPAPRAVLAAGQKLMREKRQEQAVEYAKRLVANHGFQAMGKVMVTKEAWHEARYVAAILLELLEAK